MDDSGRILVSQGAIADRFEAGSGCRGNWNSLSTDGGSFASRGPLTLSRMASRPSLGAKTRVEAIFWRFVELVEIWAHNANDREGIGLPCPRDRRGEGERAYYRP